jgi:hypothetical protein
MNVHFSAFLPSQLADLNAEEAGFERLDRDNGTELDSFRT